MILLLPYISCEDHTANLVSGLKDNGLIQINQTEMICILEKMNKDPNATDDNTRIGVEV